jgi:hypothetical protein
MPSRFGRATPPAALVLTCVLAATTFVACGSKEESTPTSPSPSVNLTGTFAGTVSDASGPGRMTWQLTQSGAQVTGTFTATDDTSGVAVTGDVSGTLSDTNLPVRMNTPAGRLPAPYTNCSIASEGTAQVTSTTINGTYTGRNSCTGTFGTGRFSLTKQ